LQQILHLITILKEQKGFQKERFSKKMCKECIFKRAEIKIFQVQEG